MLNSSLPATSTRSPSPASPEPALHEALGKARDALGRGNAKAAVDSLGDDPDTFRNALLTLLDSAPSRMRQQLVDEARSQRPHFALDAHDREGKTALDLAVRHDDTAFADCLLRQGADPNRTSLVAASTGMQALVTKWRLKKLLYAELAPGKWTPLDHVLGQGHFEEADELLRKEMGGDSLEDHAELWFRAMEEERHDVWRAMLILRREALDPLLRNRQAVAECLDQVREKDPGLSAAFKEFPYQSTKWGEPENLNGQAQFRGTAKRIECRHLATYQQEVQALDENAKIKFNYQRFFSDVETIADNVPPEIEGRYRELTAQASATHLIDNSKFGQFLAAQFREMEGEDKPATRLMLVTSTNHVMNLGLMIKEKEGKKSYVVKFFDPTETTTGTRSKAGRGQTFERQTLEDYLSNDDYRDYYPEAKGLSMIYVRSGEGERAGAAALPGSAAGRRLTTCIDTREVDATAVWYFMKDGFAANLRELQDHLPTLPEGQRIELFAGKNTDGFPALFVGMQEGHAEAVKAYGELLQQAGPIPEQQLIELLAGKNADGPALFLAMQYGHAEVVKAYGELLRQAESLPEQQRIKLLEGKMTDDTPALFIAMQNGQAEAIKAYGELIRQAEWLSEQQRIKLLAGKDADGPSALVMAMRVGSAEAVKAYGEAIQSLPPDKQADLLLAKIPAGALAGKSGFDIAVMQGHFDAARAQIELLAQLAPSLSEGKRAELLQELDRDKRCLKDVKTHFSARSIQEWRRTFRTVSKLKNQLDAAPGGPKRGAEDESQQPQKKARNVGPSKSDV